MRLRSAAQTLAASLLGALVLLAGLEGALALALASPPGSGPAGFERARQRYYMDHERRIVQYQPECAEYDPELSYRLRPGSCRFHNREFDTTLEINALGVRDSEADLRAPGVVVIGDSFAMGWGVGQDETLGARLAALTGEKVLDVAVSSWGTARELRALRRVDLSAAHTLVVQYCENDFTENQQLAIAGGGMPMMSRENYAATVREHLASLRYRPGKLLLRLFPLWWRGGAPEPPPRDCALDAEAFLAALHWSQRPPLPRGAALHALVFEAHYSPDRPSCFVRELARRARRGRLPGWIASLQVLETADLLEAGDYYPLDEHWRASGHRKVAEAVAARLAAPVAPPAGAAERPE